MNGLSLLLDLYIVLGVEREARFPEIKAAYRKLTKLRPDKFQDADNRAVI